MRGDAVGGDRPSGPTFEFTLTVNGSTRTVAADGDTVLLDVIRDGLGLTGTKYSCLEGVCGACTLLVDDEATRSCVTSIRDVAGRSITTVEGLAREDRLHPVQEAFVREVAMQCGFCTAGQLMTAAGLLARRPSPTDSEIREAMAGNVCRCCTYPRILRAVRLAAEIAAAGEETTAVRPRTDVDRWLPRPARPWDRTPPVEREYFEVLGDGLVTVLPPEAVRRPAPNGIMPWSTDGGSWLHVGANGRVTAFSGKVDVGQDNRTALAMLVADELVVPLADVQLVMGDTDTCPSDLGTFGSRSMPDAGTCLRATAAAARHALISLASEELGVPAVTLRLGDRRIVADDGRSVEIAELVSGLRSIVTTGLDGAPSAARPAADDAAAPRNAGSPTTKVSALDVVLGRRRYVLDVERPGTLTGRVLRPPAFGATLRSADLAVAREMPGVVVTQQDDFVGVAAPDLPTAERACAAIQAEWAVDPQPSEDEIVEYLRGHPAAAQGWEAEEANLGGEAASGDVEAGMAASTISLEQTYTAAYVAHVPLETRDAIAEWDGDRLTVWTGTQRPFGVRAQLSEALDIAEEDVRVIVPDTGGGFGGKHAGDPAIEAARLARAAGRPVRIRWTREEEMTWAYFRPFAIIDVRAGVDGSGRLAAWSFTNINSGPMAILTPYAVPNRAIRYQPASSPLRVGSYRGLAATANTFAREVAMDELAVACGTDPLEFRLAHLRDDRLATVLATAADRAGWERGGHSKSDGVGLGVAACSEKGGQVATVAEVRVDAQRRVEVIRLTVSFECGQIVNPDGLRNQIEGATVMGLGGALFEAVRFADGRILTPTIKEYPVPRISDVPSIEVVLVDRPDLPPAGAGETPIVGVAPAVSNAIFAACGIRLRSMPLVPDGVVAA